MIKHEFRRVMPGNDLRHVDLEVLTARTTMPAGCSAVNVSRAPRLPGVCSDQ